MSLYLDVKREKPFLSAQSFEGKRTGKYYAEHKGSGRIFIAVGNAVHESLDALLSSYPATKRQ
jgi:hypothetical protein